MVQITQCQMLLYFFKILFSWLDISDQSHFILNENKPAIVINRVIFFISGLLIGSFFVQPSFPAELRRGVFNIRHLGFQKQ